MDIPILNKDQIDKVDEWLVSIKPWFPLSQDDYTKWRLLKKCLPTLADPLAGGDGYVWALIAYKVVADKGIPNDLLCEMNSYVAP